MQVFKAYLKVLIKYKMPLIIYGALFLAITMIIVTDLKNTKIEQFSVQKVPTLVVNRDGKNEFTEGFMKYLEKYVTLEDIKDTNEARKDALFYRKVVYILTIPEGFTDAFMAGKDVSLTKQIVPDSTEALAVDNYINNYLNTVKVYKKYMPAAGMDQLNLYAQQALGNETKITFDQSRVDKERNSDTFNMYYFNYLGYVITAVFILGVSMVMLTFQNLDIRRKHYASPITVKKLNLQLILGNLVFILVYLAVFLIAGYLLNPYKLLNANIALHWLNALVFALVALSISYLVSISVKSKRAVSAISTAVSLSLAFISGMFVPQEYLGASVLKVASFTPTYWYIKANNTIQNLTSFRWSNISGVFGMMAIEVGFAAAIISIALVVNKRKSQQAC